jgi:hypothetical protein
VGRKGPLTEAHILAWADAYRQRTGQWPSATSGPVPDAPGETWAALNAALVRGHRGLRGGSSLAQVLAASRGKRNKSRLPPLTVEIILKWADRHRRRVGQLPVAGSGPVADAPGETWANINAALQQGHRGLPGGDTLARLLARHRKTAGPRRCPWTADEDALVRQLSPTEAARRTGRSVQAVYNRRYVLGISPVRRWRA